MPSQKNFFLRFSRGISEFGPRWTLGFVRKPCSGVWLEAARGWAWGKASVTGLSSSPGQALDLVDVEHESACPELLRPHRWLAASSGLAAELAYPAHGAAKNLGSLAARAQRTLGFF